MLFSIQSNNLNFLNERYNNNTFKCNNFEILFLSSKKFLSSHNLIHSRAMEDLQSIRRKKKVAKEKEKREKVKKKKNFKEIYKKIDNH